MSRAWSSVPIPLLRGEDTASAPYVAGRPFRIENGRLTGPGSLEQMPDWRLAATCTDGATENDAVCGGPWPFATQGGASAASAGIAFSFDTSANKLWLHQLGEDDTILRTLDTGYSYTEAAPPQMTGFEFFGKFIVCPYGREAAASRRGLGIYDPVGNTFTIPSLEIVAGTAAAAVIRARGVAKHRGATVIIWGYQSEETGEIDVPHILRGTRYGATDLTSAANWQVDDTDAGPWAVTIGTLGLPIVGCAESGATTIVGKVNEVFALHGDFIGQMGSQPIGKHGPVSTTGICSTGPMAVWMTDGRGPARSINGGGVELFGTDRLTRRLRTYFDLTYTTACHVEALNQVWFLLRRRSTLAGAPLTAFWPDEILWWDYERDEFGVFQTPTTCFSIGTTRGPGVSLAGPSGIPANLASSVTSNSATLSWDHSSGDPTAQISVEYRVTGSPTFTVVGPASAGSLSWLLSALSPVTGYDLRLRYYKNGQYGSYTATQTFTTAAGSAVGTPSNLTGNLTSVYTFGGKQYAVATISWTQGEFSSGSRTDVLSGTTPAFASASIIFTVDSGQVSVTTEQSVTSPPDVRYYWVRHELVDDTHGDEVGPASVTFDGVL